MLTKEQVNAYKEQQAAFNSQIDSKKLDKASLYNDNKDKVDLRDKNLKKAKACVITALIAAAVGVICFLIKNYLIAALGIALFVTFIVLRSKPAKSAKELSKELSVYDNQVKIINREISAIRTQLEPINAALARNSIEEKYAEYSKNHICVYVGQSYAALKDKPTERASYYEKVDQVTVYIDGIEYGDVRAPFAAFEVTPGPHVIKIECLTRFAGKVVKEVSSKSRQIKVNDSVYIFYHWNFYSSNIYDELFFRSYDNVYDFLVDTHQLKK